MKYTLSHPSSITLSARDRTAIETMLQSIERGYKDGTRIEGGVGYQKGRTKYSLSRDAESLSYIATIQRGSEQHNVAVSLISL